MSIKDFLIAINLNDNERIIKTLENLTSLYFSDILYKTQIFKELSSQENFNILSSVLKVEKGINGNSISEKLSSGVCRILSEFVTSKMKPNSEILDKFAESILVKMRRCIESDIGQWNFFLDLKQLIITTTAHKLELAHHILNSDWFFILFVTDNLQEAIEMQTLFLSMINLNSGAYKKLSKLTKENILDEIIYNLTTKNNPNLLRMAIKNLKTLCSIDSPTRDLIYQNYKGLKIFICSKVDKIINNLALEGENEESFKTDVDYLFFIFGIHAVSQNVDKHSDFAATKIQAVWRGYRVRSKLSSTNEALTKFQRIIRRRQTNKRKYETEGSNLEDLKFKLILARRKRRREISEKELNLLKTLPNSIVEAYLKNQEFKAACKIQAFFKTIKTKKYLKAYKFDEMKNEKAARKIQKWWRKKQSYKDCLQLQGGSTKNWVLNHLTKTQKMLEENLTDEMKERFKIEHRLWADQNPKDHVNHEHLKELHQRTHFLLQERLFLRARSSYHNERIEANAARANADMEILEAEMSWNHDKVSNKQNGTNYLNECSMKKKQQTLHCRMSSIVAIASKQHADKIESLIGPPWRLAYKRWIKYCSEILAPTEERINQGFPYWEVNSYGEEPIVNDQDILDEIFMLKNKNDELLL